MFRIDRARDARAWCVVLQQGEIVEQQSCRDYDDVRFHQLTFLGVGGGKHTAALVVVYGDTHVESVSTPLCYIGLIEGECN